VNLSLQHAAQVMGSASGLTGDVSGFSIDSRTVAPGDLFFAIRGDNHDGHQFVASALAAGATAAVVDRDLAGVVPDSARLIRVDNTLRALQCLAATARQDWNGTVIGVTGSAGKTSTKDIVADLVGSAIPIGCTTGNFNNHIGVPLSVLRIPEGSKAAVLELGMNHAGEIRDLAAIARPQIGVVTNVGYAHVENFETGIDGITLAKRELIEALPRDGVAVLNHEDERVRAFAGVHPGETVYYGFSPEADVRAEDVELDRDGIRFRVAGKLFESSLSGRHAVLNILAGIAVTRVFGIDQEPLPDVVRSLRPGKMRGQRIERNGALLIDDCYNSNPDALRSMLEVLRDIPARRHIAVLGEMLELGRWSESLHREAGIFAARCGITVLVGIRGVAEALVKGAIEAGLRKDAAYFFHEPAEAGAWLQSFVQPGDVVLFKGSRGTHVETALQQLLAE